MREPKQLGVAPKMKVEVSAAVIADACTRDSSHCMIADALRKKRPELSHIAVDIQTIRATSKAKSERYIWLTPRDVQKAIIAFDQGKKPAPFDLKLAYGQTVPMMRRSDEDKEKLRISWRKNGKHYPSTKAKFKRSKGDNARSIPQIVGGKAPPVAAGRRREFGLRAMEA